MLSLTYSDTCSFSDVHECQQSALNPRHWGCQTLYIKSVGVSSEQEGINTQYSARRYIGVSKCRGSEGCPVKRQKDKLCGKTTI